MKKRDLNELYGMVCNNRYQYSYAVQTVVTFSGLQGDELNGVLPKYVGCLLYTADAADDLLCLYLGCRVTIKDQVDTIYYNSHVIH